MGALGDLITFACIWWLVLFMVLPWGVRVAAEDEEASTAPGQADSAPVRPRLGLKLGVTTAISVVLFLVVYWIVTAGLIRITP